jgi:hypothetical protein
VIDARVQQHTNWVAEGVVVLERAERLERGCLQRSGDWRVLAIASQTRRRVRTRLGFVHGGVRVRLGGGIVVGLAALAVADLAFVFGTRPALGGRQLVALVAAEAEVRVRARTLRLLGLLHGGRHVPRFPGRLRKLRL